VLTRWDRQLEQSVQYAIDVYKPVMWLCTRPLTGVNLMIPLSGNIHLLNISPSREVIPDIDTQIGLRCRNSKVLVCTSSEHLGQNNSSTKRVFSVPSTLEIDLF